MAYQYGEHPPYEYHHPEATYVVAPPPPSAFSPSAAPVSPHHHDPYAYPPQSPLVVAASPAPSVGAPSRSSSRPRGGGGEYMVGERAYLAPGGYSNSLSRSNSERGRRGQIVVEGARHGHSRSHSEKVYYEVATPRRKKYYIDDDDAYSAYSGSSYGGAGAADSRGHSRGHSRSHSRHRHHSRTSSCDSRDSYDDDDRYAVGLYRPRKETKPSKLEAELTKQLQDVQKKLEKVQVDAEKKRMEDEHARLEKQRSLEIERKVAEQLRVQKQKEAEADKRRQAELEAEKKRIADAAKRLLDEQAAAAAAAKAEEDKKKAEIEAILQAERAKYQAAQQGKKTYTRFSKTHLCKEALEERNIPFTEEADYFLVHRFVEKSEQQYLWARTKEIRTYYRQIQEAADKAPTVAGPNGGYVKYVQIAGQPYPLALPVTITHTPGGGQTQRVEPHKIKWSDIFKVK